MLGMIFLSLKDWYSGLQLVIELGVVSLSFAKHSSKQEQQCCSTFTVSDNSCSIVAAAPLVGNDLLLSYWCETAQ